MRVASFIALLLLAIIYCISTVHAESCPQFDPFEYPMWPTNANISFGVEEVSDTNLVVSFKGVEKYFGAIQYLRMTPLDAKVSGIIASPEFDSGSNASLAQDLYTYSNYDDMFQNARYSSQDNEDCTVDISVDFPIQDILASTSVFTVNQSPNVITVDVPFYLGYAVTSRQSGINWQYQENLFIARLVINTLVRADGTKDVLNTACSSTVSAEQYGVIVCFYTSNSPLKVSDFSMAITGSSTSMYDFYSSSAQGKSEVKFQTVDKIESALQLNAQVSASICVVGAGDVCESTTDYLSPSIPYSFKTGSGEVTLDQEATMLFSNTITQFDAQTDAETIIGAQPEFFLLVTTKTPKSIWRIRPNSDIFSVELTAVPKYTLPSYPVFPTGNTVTVYTESNFPANVDPAVLNGQFVSYILRFDNSRERYSRASEDPILFRVQFNIESRNARRRLTAVNQPTAFTISKSLSSECTGADCQLVGFDNSAISQASFTFGLLVAVTALWTLFAF